MASTIKIKNSSTAGAAPTASDLVQGELAVNVTDKRIYTENASGTVVELGTNPSIPVTFSAGSAAAPALTTSGDTDTGVLFPAANTVAIATAGSERARIDSTGKVGINVTPNTWSAGENALQMAAGGHFVGNGETSYYTANAYYNAGYKYVGTGYAARYAQYQGQHQWSTAASGTAGNSISFTQAMTLDASGNLGLGSTSPTGISGYTALKINNATNGAILDLAQGDAYKGRLVATSTSFALETSGTIPIVFSTGGSEDARIDSSGNLLVGTTTATGKVTISGIGGSNGNSLYISSWGSGIGAAATWKAANTSNADVMYFETSAAQVGKISITSTATSYVTSSDYRLKENIAPMTGALSTVAQLKPCTYTWKATGEDGQGFIAHELQAVVPDAVTGEKDEVKEDGTPLYQGIDTSFLVAILTAAIQELNAKFEAYKATHP